MALKFGMTGDVGLSSGIKVAVYGRSGAGKTTLASTAPAPIILSAESGLLSLRKFNLPYVEIKTVMDLTEAHSWLSGNPSAKQFKTIVIDSVSEIGEVVLANAKKQVKDPRQAYGELIEKTMMALRAFRDIPGFNVAFLFKMESVTDEVTKITKYGPSMPGSKLGPAMPYLFDGVFHLGIGNLPDGRPYRFLQTAPDIQYDAKDRSGFLSPLEPPNLALVFEKMLGHNSPAN